MSTLTPERIKALLTYPCNFGYSGELPVSPYQRQKPTWTVGPVIRTRDSEVLERANAQALENALDKAGFIQFTHLDDSESNAQTADYSILGANHWAVGWVDHLSYRVLDSICDTCNGRGSHWTPPPSDYSVPGFETPCGACQGLGGSVSRIAQWVEEWFETLADYPVADEDLYSEMESEEAYNYINDMVGSLDLRLGITAGQAVDSVMEHLESDDWYDDKAIREHLETEGYLDSEEPEGYEPDDGSAHGSEPA